jgi:hypothetical protein
MPPAGMVAGEDAREAVGLLVVNVVEGEVVIGKVNEVQLPEQVMVTVLLPDSGA